MRMPRAAATVLAAALASVLLAGCAGWVTERIVAPPRSATQLAWTKRTLERAEVPFERLKRRKAPDIAYAVFEPGDYALRYQTFSFSNDTWSALVDWRAPVARQPARHGTVVLVHGWSMDAGMMLPWAMAFAERGFRAVVVELRGHGRSQAGRMGYGKREADDVLAVVAHLRRKHRLAEPLHLFGISYGAVTVLHAAARMAVAAGGEPAEDVRRAAGDDARDAAVRAARPAPPAAVVAMEPFANAADAIRSMHQFATTSLRGGWRHWLVRNSARMLVGEATIETAIANASRRLELDLAELDTSVALAGTTTCPLLVHGRIDTVIPHQSSRTLAAAHPQAQLVELPQDGHFSTAGRIDLLADPVANWFVALAGQEGCAPFAAPASTLLGHDGFEKDRIPANQRRQMRAPGGAVNVRARE